MRKLILLTITLLSVAFTFAQKATVTGTVYDDRGTSLPGAYIRDAKGTAATVTDSDGKYAIELEAAVKELGETVEKFTIAFDNTTGKLKLTFAWDTTLIEIPIEAY